MAQSSLKTKYGVCKKFITKLTDYFFAIIYLGTTSFGNEPLFTQQKEKSRLIQCFGPMFIAFDEYPHFSGRESIIFEKDVNEAINVNIAIHIMPVNVPFANGLMGKLGK